MRPLETEPFSPDHGQTRVLEHERGPLLVTGSAGTGKSAALRERFARLIEAGADPERVAFVARSKRDQRQARAALLARLPGSLPSLKVVTVHGLAFHVVSERFADLGYESPPEVLSAADQFARVRDLLQGEDPAQWPAYGAMLPLRGFADEVRQFLLRAQEALLTPELIEDKARTRGLAGWNELAAFYRRYVQVLDSESAVDFAGLLGQAARAAARKPPFDHLLVDDYQDATFAAEALVVALAPESLVVAGDPDAHVFSFQGTTDVPIRRFSHALPTSERVELDVKHRGEDVEHRAWIAPHSSEEHAAIARELRRIHASEGVPWSELAVVVRRQDEVVGGITRALDDVGVPRSAPDTGTSLIAEPATYPFVLALRWIARPHERDELAEQVLTSELGGTSPATARGLLRAARVSAASPAGALEQTESLSSGEIESFAALRSTLKRAEDVAGSVLDAFKVLWQELPYSARLVASADASTEKQAGLDAVLALAEAIAEAGGSGDRSVEAFLGAIEAGGEGPGIVALHDRGEGAVQILTAHGAAGREFDTVIVAGAAEGDFPSLTRPEPMFDLSVLDGWVTQSERNRLRLEDERRLLSMVVGRARLRVLFTATDPAGEPEPESARSRFVQAAWTLAPSGPFDDPVTLAEAAATWRHTLADRGARAVERLASLEGLLALGVEPSRWWFQREWTDTGRPLVDHLRLSYSRLDKLENCELQYVLGEELGLSRRGGYQASVGKLVHALIEDCEKGKVPRELDALHVELDARWNTAEFPSLAVGEAFRQIAHDVLLPNWWRYFGALPAIESEVRFEFEFDGATISGVIDRIGPKQNGNRITDFKTGKSDKAPKAKDSLQLGIYYLAVNEAEELAPYRPITGVDLAYLRGKWNNADLDFKAWPISPTNEEEYQTQVRQHLSELVAQIRELNETETYRPSPYAECFFCDFKTLCPLYPEGQPVFDVRGPS